jgi:hypothetical protein
MILNLVCELILLFFESFRFDIYFALLYFTLVFLSFIDYSFTLL